MPLLLGVIPFGFITGATAVDAGIPPLQAILMSSLVFAGAAQLAAIELYDQAAPVGIIVLTAVIVNLRHLMYSASIAPYFNRFSSGWRWVCAYGLTDQTYAVSLTEFQSNSHSPQSSRVFYLGAAVTIWVAYQLSTTAGVVIGARIPSELSLSFAVPLTFIALLFTVIEDRTTTIAALVAGSIGVLSGWLPYELGLLSGALVGVAVATFIQQSRTVADSSQEISACSEAPDTQTERDNS